MNSNELAVNVDATLTYAAKRILDAKLPRLAKIDGYDRKTMPIWSGIPFADATDVQAHFLALNLAGIESRCRPRAKTMVTTALRSPGF